METARDLGRWLGLAVLLMLGGGCAAGGLVNPDASSVDGGGFDSWSGADGSSVKAVNTITPESADSYTWRSTERLIDDEKAPDIGPIKVVRAGKAE